MTENPVTEHPVNYARIIRFFTLGLIGIVMVATIIITIASQITPT